MKATEILLEAAKKRYPKSSDETINRQTLAVFGKEAVKNALKAQGFSDTIPFCLPFPPLNELH